MQASKPDYAPVAAQAADEVAPPEGDFELAVDLAAGIEVTAT
jgi:hypothetical protein